MTIQQELTQATLEWTQKAREQFNRQFADPVVKCTVRGVTAGKAYLREWMVNYNPALFQENHDDFLARTVPHEVAHLIAYDIHKVGGHGWAWKSVMARLGISEIKRCHSYDTTNTRVRRVARVYMVKCSCRTVPLTITRWRRMMQGTKYYTCGRCHTRFVPCTAETQPEKKRKFFVDTASAIGESHHITKEAREPCKSKLNCCNPSSKPPVSKSRRPQEPPIGSTPCAPTWNSGSSRAGRR